MNKKPKVALISPQVIGAVNQIRKCAPPLGIAYLAAVLEEKGYKDILLIDAAVEDYNNIIQIDDKFVKFGLSDENIIERLRIFRPDIVGISVLFASQTECALSLAKKIRDEFPDRPIIFGGNHITQISGQFIKNDCVDFIICGEGEYAFFEFLEKYFVNKNYMDIPGLVYKKNGKVHKNPRPPFIKDLDKLPFPAFHLYPVKRYYEIGMWHNPFVRHKEVAGIFTSRGCPYRCYYCSVHGFLGGFRAMSSKRVIEYIQCLVNKFAIKELQILDDCFNVDYNRVIEIFEGIKHLNLRICFPNAIRADLPKDREKRKNMFKIFHDTGVEKIDFSPEHGDQDFLKNVLKKTLDLNELATSCNMAHDAGMLVHVNFMMGFPFETEENRRKTIEFARSLDADSFSISLVAPLPGTPLWDITEKNNLFVDSFDPNKMVLAKVNIKPHDIPPEKLYEIVDKLNRELNETAQKRRPEKSTEYYRLFKGKTANGDRKFHFIDS